jgi:hypothetical protein
VFGASVGDLCQGTAFFLRNERNKAKANIPVPALPGVLL